MSVLEVTGLRVVYDTARGPVRGADGVSFTLEPGRRLGLVGESGSGKSTTALAIMRLLKPPARIEAGSVLLDSVDLLALRPEAMRRVRWSKISMVPQGAMNSLNPVLRIREQFFDTLRAHHHVQGAGLRGMRRHVDGLLESVGLRPHVADMFPHELSGGMKQRVCIALAVCLEPRVIIADEPTSALDVVVQRQVMETFASIQSAIGAAVVLIGHDMGLMAQFVDQVGVMYAGRLVELGSVERIFREPLHPYTQHLIASIPSLDAKRFPTSIPGSAPSLLDPPPGCRFHPRCSRAFDTCRVDDPVFREVHADHGTACHLYETAAP